MHGRTIVSHQNYFPIKKESTNFFTLAIAFIYMLPLNLSLGSFSDKPIDLAVSNLLLLLTLKPFFTGLRVSPIMLAGLLLPVMFISLGIVSSLLHGGEIGLVLSAVSFSLPMFHVFVGYIIAKSYENFSFLQVSFAFSIVIFLLLASDIFSGGFPRGCGYQGRWGGCIGSLEVYGFPNAPSNFLAVCSPLLALPIIRSGKKFQSIAAIIAIIGLMIILPLSLSRSALFVFTFSLFFLLLMFFRLSSVFVISALGIIIALNLPFFASLSLFEGVTHRFDVAIEAGDISNGRTLIWQNALSLSLENPFFGKAFVAYSNFSRWSTVHQQYLEVLYKTGIIGFIAYFGYLFVTTKIAYRSLKKKYGLWSGEMKVFIAFGVCLFVANLFQPAISYQPLGNFLFFAIGIFLGRQKRTPG